jgi:hypothetical protein
MVQRVQDSNQAEQSMLPINFWTAIEIDFFFWYCLLKLGHCGKPQIFN